MPLFLVSDDNVKHLYISIPGDADSTRLSLYLQRLSDNVSSLQSMGLYCKNNDADRQDQEIGDFFDYVHSLPKLFMLWC
jgi:hypothetical protein